MTFPKEETPSHSVHTRHYYGFSSKIGGGFYARPMLYPDFVAAEEAPEVYRISKTSTADPGEIYTTLTEATSKWSAEGRKNAIFEILDSESYYEASLELDIPSQVRIVIRSKQQATSSIAGARTNQNQRQLRRWQ